MRINLYVATISLLAYTGLAVSIPSENIEAIDDFTDEFAQKFHHELAQYEDSQGEDDLAQFEDLDDDDLAQFDDEDFDVDFA